MSDPVTNVEVEDVLSSIRRLVSDEKSPASLSDAATSNDRLVLTPALRVADTDGDQSKDYPEAVDDLDVAAKAAQQAWSDFGADPDHNSSPDDEIALAAEVVAAEVDKDEDGTADLYDAQAHADDTSEDDQVNQMLESVAEAKPEPLILEMPTEVEVEAPLSEVELDEPVQNSNVPDAELVQDQDEAAFFSRSAVSLSAKIAALETVIGRTEEQWEPDDTGDSDYSGTEAPAMKWEADDAADKVIDEPADEVIEEPQPVEQSVDNAETESVFGQTGDDILDEETLRDLVSEIVREELQGALGERITRNVRKLVRREIHRALAAQDFD